jgi:hypothetical protein
MIRSVTTLLAGVAIAVLIIVVAAVAAIGVVGLAVKAALFGEPRATLAMKVFERVIQRPTVITHITPETEDHK